MRDALPLMIFAAGFGTRMGALTAHIPKPLIPLAGRSLIERAIDLGEGAGCAPIVANIHYLSHLLDPVLESRGVSVSHEDGRILDTGGGLKRALPLLGRETVATLNPDAAWRGPNPLSHLARQEFTEGIEALLLLVPTSRARGHSGPGDFAMDPDGRLSRSGDLVYSGAQVLRTTRVRDFAGEVFSLNAVWNAMAEEGRLSGVVYPGLWCDVGHPDGLAEAEAMLADAADDA